MRGIGIRQFIHLLQETLHTCGVLRNLNILITLLGKQLIQISFKHFEISRIIHSSPINSL
jgi:hypothetical protein